MCCRQHKTTCWLSCHNGDDHFLRIAQVSELVRAGSEPVAAGFVCLLSGLELIKSDLMKMVTMITTLMVNDNNEDDKMLMTITGMHCTAAPLSWELFLLQRESKK